MTHARQQIRDAVVTAITGLTTTGSNVFAGRVYPLTNGELPGACVYTLNESSELVTKTTLLRQVQVNVEAYVKADENFEDTVDQIAAEVEAAIESNTALQALVKDIHPTEFEKDILREGEKPVGIGVMTFMTTYTTNPTDPETIT